MTEAAEKKIIRGVLAIPRVSRNNRLYLPSELEAAVKRLDGKVIPVYWEHVAAMNVIGRAKLSWNPELMQVEYEAEILDPEAEKKVGMAPLKVSLGADYERIDRIDGIEVLRNIVFKELSLVAVPGIPEASVQVVESVIHIREKAVPFEATKKADEGRSWDRDRAVASLRKWASKDGSGEKDTIDWSRYRRGFAWYDESDAENFGSYKLPHHEVLDDELVVVWRGVAAAMAALFGARGGVDIPSDDRRPVYNHLAKHYEQFGKEPPAFEKLEELRRKITEAELMGSWREAEALTRQFYESVGLPGPLRRVLRVGEAVIDLSKI
ncbi:MAG: hypothetical protein QW544_03570 [Candidatus Caldarchaeum sp.]